MALFRPSPSYNHTRADGPYDPCPACLELMSRNALIACIKDLQECIADLRERRSDSAQCGIGRLEHVWSEGEGYCNCGAAHRSTRGEKPAYRPETAIRPMDPTTNRDAIGYLVMLAKCDANGGELDLIEKCEEYLRAALKRSDDRR